MHFFFFFEEKIQISEHLANTRRVHEYITSALIHHHQAEFISLLVSKILSSSN